MTPKERELLQNFLQQLEQTRVGAKDADADAMIRGAVARQPEAAYLLVQRAMGLDLALQAAQAQIAKLQSELDSTKAPAPASGSFLDNPNAWGRQAVPLSPSPQLARPASAPAAPAASAPQPAAASSAWGSGILGSLATTAAGVVAGSLLYQGIQGLMGHHGSSSYAGNTGFGADGPPAGQADSVRDLVANSDGPPAGSWPPPAPQDQVSDDSTYLADAGDVSFDDDEFA